MRGLLDLSTILANLNPELMPGEFVFCSVPNSIPADVLHLVPVGIFAEHEGLTLILNRQCAEENNIPFEVSLRKITLTVHSDLEAVGLTAAISTALSNHGISANMVSGFYHDHIFVPSPVAEDAVKALIKLQAEASA
jgi:uncharacterized protein